MVLSNPFLPFHKLKLMFIAEVLLERTTGIEDILPRMTGSRSRVQWQKQGLVLSVVSKFSVWLRECKEEKRTTNCCRQKHSTGGVIETGLTDDAPGIVMLNYNVWRLNFLRPKSPPPLFALHSLAVPLSPSTSLPSRQGR